jgi:hypothetical protein
LQRSSRDTVDGDRPIMAAMARIASPRARPSAISSRCANVRHRPSRLGLDDIQTTLKANQALVHGSVLLRVTGQVKPSRAKAYATAFTS